MNNKTPFTQNTLKYNFKDYWKSTYSSLLLYKSMIEDEVKEIEENFIKRSDDGYSITMPTIVHDDLCKFYAELKYLNRVIRVRKFWRPRDWRKNITELLESYYYKVDFVEKQKRKREEHLSEDNRIPYYRKQVQKIEKKLIKMFSKDESDCTWSELEGSLFEDLPEKVKEKAKELLSERCYYLDLMFRATDVEIKRLEEVNETLRHYTKFLKKQTLEWDNREKGLFDDNEAWEGYNEANMIWAPANEGTILPYEGDDFYGSDFNRMIEIEKDVFANDSLEPCANILVYHDYNEEEDTKNKVYSDEIKISVTGDLDEELPDWKTGKWHRPEFKHIQVCHAVHHLYDHLNLPIVDILHVNSYHLEFKRENHIYLDIIETHHPKGFGKYYRREEYEEAFKAMK